MSARPASPQHQRLAFALADWMGPATEKRLSHLVIGSGYGGAVATCRLAEAGHAVVMLERGSEFLPGEFANDIAHLPKFARAPAVRGPGVLGSANALFDWQIGDKVMALTANGLGGGSLINAGVLFEPDADVLQQREWPALLRHQGEDAALGLGQAMARARQMLGDHAWPDGALLAKTRALGRSATFLQPGAKAEAVHATIDPARCTRCGDCASGCNVAGAKLTLRDTYLAQAVRHGATLVTGGWAYRIEPPKVQSEDPSGVHWKVTVLHTERVAAFGKPSDYANGPQALVLWARRLVVAAGTFGSTELLQRSQALCDESLSLSPALGTRFSGNGDSLSFVADLPEAVHAEGQGARHADPGTPKPGPTITAVVDLRRHSTGPRLGQLKPMEERLIVEDGATPGAIARVAGEMLATQYLTAQLDRLSFRKPRLATQQGRSAASGAGPAVSSSAAAAQGVADTLAYTPMLGHTQVLLTMGHDGAQGRVVRVPERDRSVPFWPEDPAQLATYRRQAEAFAGLNDSGGVHLHPPSWQLLPASSERLMSGPKAPKMMLTVHPLGGCPMADQFEDGVVDHRGRVWRGSGRLWPGLMVLDGSIVPTSLGVNPMLTITALAERAMAYWLHEEASAHALSGAAAAQPPTRVAMADTKVPDAMARGRTSPQPSTSAAPTTTAAAAAPTTAAAACAAPRAFERREAAEFDITLFERLVCDASQFTWQGGHRMHAELRLELGSKTWLKVWGEARHRVELSQGKMRLQTPLAAADRKAGPAWTLEYRVVSGWFELLPQGSTPRHHEPADSLQAARRRGAWAGFKARWAERLGALGVLFGHLPLLLTWGAMRGLDDLRRAKASGRTPTGLVEQGVSLAKGLAHAAECRRMRYQLQLQRIGPADDRLAPPRLKLIGSKDIRYGATLPQLLRWAWQHGRAALQGTGVPPPRPTWWAQVTNPKLVLLAADAGPFRQWLARCWPTAPGPWAAWGHGHFQVDAAQFIAQAPLLLHSGDLTAGMEAQAAYGMLFLRHAVKTHLSDFRLPDYSGRALRDLSGAQDVLHVHGQDIRPEAHPLLVRRGRSEGEPQGRNWPPQLSLQLWHYRRPARPADDAPMLRRSLWYGQPVWRARSVLLVHAFGQSGAMFTLGDKHPSLARSLLEQGFDVWVLDHRISTRLPYTDWPSTIDHIARFDLPAALDEVIQQLQRDHLDPALYHEPIQPFAFAQCIGGAALAMSLLDGRLSHAVEAQTPAASGAPDEGPLPLMPKLAGAVISQTHPFLVGTAVTRAKTWVPDLLRNALGGGAVPLAVRGPVNSLPEAWMDRLFASLPVPADEHCPRERDALLPQDDCATCRRIRFIEAPLFKHRNLSAEMHALLPRLFGNANLHLFAHAATCVEHERLVDHDGRGVYVRDDHWRRHFGLAVAFMHGEQNELFDVSSARRSAVEHARLFPDMAQAVARALGRTGIKDAEAAAWLLPGYGHVDPVIGKDAPTQVFEPMARMFDALWRSDEHPLAPSATQLVCAAHLPLSGPWVGHVEALAHNRLRVHLAFYVDDRFSGGKQGPEGAPGSRSWAFVRAGRGAAARLFPLQLQAFQMRPDTEVGPRADADPATAGYRIAWGCVEVERPGKGCALLLRGFTVHDMLWPVGSALRDGLLSPPAELAACRLGAQVEVTLASTALVARLARARAPAAAAVDPVLCTWAGRLLQAHALALRQATRRRRWLGSQVRPVSRQTQQRRDGLRHGARLSATLLEALATHAPAAQRQGVAETKTQQAPAVRHELQPIEFAASSCRYPGMAIDSPRVDDSARALLACAEGAMPGPSPLPQPAFAFLLGDQIYADATAGMVDSNNPVERFVQRHRDTMMRGGRHPLGLRQVALGDLLARVPTYLSADDHEFRDGYPGSGPLQPGLEQGRARESRLHRVALHAVQGFQRLHMPPRVGDGGSYRFDAGPVRFFVLDTRTERRLHKDALGTFSPETFSTETWQALEAWWAEPEANQRLNCLATGSVLVPRLAPGSNPADPGEDSLSWSPRDRERLLLQLQAAARCRRRFLLLSGDYHVSAALSVQHEGRTCGAVVVAPPLYAPLAYTNATREALCVEEDLSRFGLQLSAQGSWDGSGFAALKVSPRATSEGGHSFTLSLRNWLRDHAQGDAAGHFSQDVRIHLP